MTKYEIYFEKVAAKEYGRLDGSVRNMVDKGLVRLNRRPEEIGKSLSGPLKGCRELKFRANGIRIIYRVIGGQIQIVQVLAIGKRTDGIVFRNAEHRLMADDENIERFGEDDGKADGE